MPDGTLAWVGIITAFIGAGGLSGFAVNWLNNRTTREKDWYDQLQEDRLNDRLEIQALRDDVNRLKGVDQIKDDYIMNLRRDIADGKPPPPRPWPSELRGVTA